VVVVVVEVLVLVVLVVLLDVVVVSWADAVHGVPPSIVPAANVAGTAAAAITAQRISGEGRRSSLVGFWVILCSLLL